MKKQKKARIFTGIAAASIAAASLFNAYLQTPSIIIKNDENVVYMAKGANGQEIIGVLDKANISSNLGKRDAAIIKTSQFVVVPPIDEFINNTAPIKNNSIENNLQSNILNIPSEYTVYLPIIFKDQYLNWPADHSRTGYWRPVPGGVSIGHPETTSGTLGGRICYEGYGCNCFITNAHVAGGLNGAKIGDPILQPGPHDGGKAGDEIGNIVAIISPKKGVNNTVDVAIACGSPENLFPEIYDIGAVNNIYEEPSAMLGGESPSAMLGGESLSIGMTAIKCGRTSGCTTLTLIGKDATVKVSYLIDRKWVTYTFVHQLLWEGTSGPGDSGSMIVTDHLWDALLFAGNADNQVMSNDPYYIFQSIPGAYLPGMQGRGLDYP